MDLTPKLPPGRANRKAKAFTAQIQHLRQAGYTFEAIRLLLLDVGLDVSRATVKREADKGVPVDRAARASHGAPPVHRNSPSSSAALFDAAALSPSTESSPAGRSYAGDARRGKAIAAAYMQDQITNPLLRERMLHEDRSD